MLDKYDFDTVLFPVSLACWQNNHFGEKIIKKAFDTFKTMLIKDRPSLVIVIDYPGFNLRAAAFAWKHSIPVLYYITPKVWAWNRSRIKKIRKYVSHAALILPFEEPLFRKEKIPSTFVGHPLLDYYTEETIKQGYKKKIVKKDGEKKGTEYEKTFTIKSPTDFNFISGQYCLVSFVDNKKFKDQRKPFTFTNSPTDKGFIELTIKKIGLFTTALFSLKIGDLLKIRGPIGRFLNFDETIKKNVVLIAGGSGITPFMSIIRYSLAKNLPNEIIMFNGNRTVDDIIFREYLEEIDDEENNIKTEISLS